MVRGTNKRIIEINDTQNPYFDRAVLYLKDMPEPPPKQAVESQAQRFLHSLGAQKPRGAKLSLWRLRGRRWFWVCKLLLSAAAGGAITLLLVH